MLQHLKPNRVRIRLQTFFIITCLAISGCDGPSPSPMVAPAAVSSDGAIVVEATTREGFIARHTAPSTGILTAGDIDDTLNLASFLRYQRAAASATNLPTSNLSRPILASLRDINGRPAPHVHFTLRNPNAPEPFFEGYSGVDGNITVFPAALGGGGQSEFELRAFQQNQGAVSVTRLQTTGARIPVTLPFASSSAPDFLDLAFVIDTTGSMADELRWITEELKSIVRSARRNSPGIDIRYGLIVYRDNGDNYVVRNFGFTKSERQMQRWLRSQNASGGGDYPEAAAAALEAGVAMAWRRGKGKRLLFHIADAPPHDRDAATYLAAASRAAAQNIQIFGLGASGVAAESEFLMRQAALESSGRYLFLTDDSGVGNHHAEPTISCYRATELNQLMIRVLASELSGERIEAPESQIVRRVGSYNRGVCHN